MGHKVKKYGRVVMMAACFIFIIFYMGTSLLYIVDGGFMAKIETYKQVLIAGAVILFGVMEVLIYRVNKKSMVVL